VREGTIHALIGPNGAGKTTLLNLVSGVVRPTSGDVRFGGRSIARWSPSAIALAGIARTFQQPALFPRLTVIDNVVAAAYAGQPRMGLRELLATPACRRLARAMREEALDCLAFVGLAARASQGVGLLSPAERRLVEMARAMATKPKVLLLDEPFAGMTMGEAELLYERVLLLRARGVAVLLIDHNMRIVMKIADRITVLNFGRKIAEGTPAQVQASAAVTAAYLGKPVAAA